MSHEATYDVLVAGAGPAGLSAAAALAERGLRVASVGPIHPPDWPNTFGVWLDELEEAGLADFAARRWSTTRVAFAEGAGRRLDRSYALLDNARLRDALVERAEGGEVDWIEGMAHTSERLADRVRVTTKTGDTLQARLVVDATGHRPALARRSDEGAPGFQTAVGIVAECDDPPVGPDEMMLMDFRPVDVQQEGPPTFLYVMEIEEGRYLFEETVLVARPPVGFDRLQARLDRRLDQLDVGLGQVVDRERVSIPMGLPLPDARTPAGRHGILPFGGAASMVHPATGYMVGRMFRAVDPMADAVAEALLEGGPGSASRAVDAGWEAIWPADTRRTRQLLTFGMETLLELDADKTRRFFEAFFRLDGADWRDYLSGTAGPGRTAGIMMQVFGRASLGVKGTLARAALSPRGLHILKGITER